MKLACWFSCAALLAALALPLPPVWAQDLDFDAVAVPGLLSDDDFFRLAACGAPPGRDCAGPVVTWPKRRITVALLPGEAELDPARQAQLDMALDQALEQINGAGADLRLVRTDRRGANVRLYVTDAQPGDVMESEAGISAPGIMGVGYSTIWWNAAQRITNATILISTAIEPHDIRSVMLEEVYQALGPRFDIVGVAYEGVSILSQDSNATVTIAGQDARLLDWLYPARN